MAIFPLRSLILDTKKCLLAITNQLAVSLGVKALINIQYVLHEDTGYVIEVNSRSSRTILYMSKE